MHQSLSLHKTFEFHHLLPPSSSSPAVSATTTDFIIPSSQPRVNRIKTMVLQNPVIVIGRKGCCMGHVVKRLLLSLGVNPAVYELDDEEEEAVVPALLDDVKGGGCGGGSESEFRVQFPLVFIGGKLFGELDKVMATHISGELTPILKEAGALWL